MLPRLLPLSNPGAPARHVVLVVQTVKPETTVLLEPVSVWQHTSEDLTQLPVCLPACRCFCLRVESIRQQRRAGLPLGGGH